MIRTRSLATTTILGALASALGKAGGFGFAGSEGVRREATADLIRRLVSGTSEDKTAAR